MRLLPHGPESYLSITVDQNFHYFVVNRSRHTWLNEKSARHLELVAVPKLSLFHWQLGECVAADDVFYACQTSRVGSRYVYGALNEIFPHDCTVVVCLKVVAWLTRNEVESIQEEHEVLRTNKPKLIAMRGGMR